MFAVEALPLVHAFSLSDDAGERAVFVRVYLDALAELSRRNETLPADWFAALQACLAKARPSEREHYLAEIGTALLFGKAKPAGEAAPAPRLASGAPARPQNLAFATREEIDAIVKDGGLEDCIALASERLARLRADHTQALVARARATLATSGDRRLTEALLSRDPVRLEAAPLFLEATPRQRWSILLAAQRADLGRKSSSAAPQLDAQAAERLEFAAIAGDAGEFVGLLGEAIGAEPELAARIATDPGGEPLAVALAALGAPRDVAVRILTARDLQDGDGFPRINALARLSNQLSLAAARRIVSALVAPATGAAEQGVAPPAPPPQPAQPAPLQRRANQGRRFAASPETPVQSAQNSRRP